MSYDDKLLEEKFNGLPEDLKEAITSANTGDMLQKIGDSHGLMLDQTSDLLEEMGYVMLGLTPADSFVEKITKRLNINEEEATAIAKDINDIIFRSIRISLQKIQSQEPQPEQSTQQVEQQPVTTPAPEPLPKSVPLSTPLPISPNTLDLGSIEKVGNFRVETRPPSHSPQYNDSRLSRDAVLDDLENIERLRPENAHEYVEHLLTGDVSTPPPPAAPKKPMTPPPLQGVRKSGIDPYRESTS